MTKQKKWFRAIAILFAVLLGYAAYDIGRRTTFPGSKPQLKERIEQNFFNDDSTDAVEDSVNSLPLDTVH